MNYYAVQYSYLHDADLVSQHRPAHREYLLGLPKDQLIVSGPYLDADTPGALLIVRAESPEAAAKLLDGDPFWLQQLITERRITAWNPVIGSLAN